MKKMNLLKKIFAGFTTLQLLIAMFVPLMVPNVAMADDTGYQNPTSNINTGWLWPSAAYNSDNTWYSVADSGSDVVQYKNFNFNIPVGAAIDGVEVAVEGFTLGLGSRQADVSLSWNAGSNWTSSVTTNMPRIIQGEVSRVYGSSTNLWGRAAWDYNDFSNANFSLKVDANNATLSSLNIDSVAVKVYYTPDTQKPTATVTSPLVNSNIKGGFTVCGTSSDNSDVDYIKVRFQDPTDWDYINNGFTVIPDVNGNWCVDINGTSGNNIADGVWGIRLVVTDIARNTNNNLKFSPFILDNISPTGSIITPGDSTYSNTGFVNVTGMVADENSGIDYVQVRARTLATLSNGARVAMTNWVLATVGVNSDYNAVIDLSTFPERADYEICVVAYDNAGNNKWLWPRPVINFDKTPPVSTYNSELDVTNPTNDNNPDVTGKYYGEESSAFMKTTDSGFKTDIEKIDVVYIPVTDDQNIGLSKGVFNYYHKGGVLDGNGNYHTNDGDSFGMNTPFFVESVRFAIQNGNTQILPDGEYTVEAWAFDAAGNKTSELINNSLIIDTIIPETPLNLSVTGQTDDTVGLNWNTSTDISTGVLGYKVFWGTSPGIYTNSMSVGNVTSYTVSGLNADTQYYFSVAAYDYALNESAKSMEVTARTNSETFNFNVLTPIAFATPGVETTTEEVLGATDENIDEQEKDVKGSENTNEDGENKDTQTAGTFFGLMWYWWVLIVAGLTGGYWLFAAWRRRRKEV